MSTTTEGKAAGGLARAASLTPAERSAIAKAAATSRWSDDAVHEVLAGSPDLPLRIGDAVIECYVLDDNTRVITQGSILTALGRSPRAAGVETRDERLPPILQSKTIRDYIPDSVIEMAKPIVFKTPYGSRANGYRAELLPVICEIYLAARQGEKDLPLSQKRIAQQAEVLMRGLATVGIIALVDEATGYQDIRTRDALSQILEMFIAKELQRWVRTFPEDYYKQLFRLRGITYDPGSVKRPGFFGGITNDIIYDRLAPGVREELKKAQKKADRSGKMFQHLTTTVGYPKLREHLGSVVTLMKLSPNWEYFYDKLNELHPSYVKNIQPYLWVEEELGL